MSYWANGSGHFKVSQDLKASDIETLLETLDPDGYFEEIEYDSRGFCIWTCYHENYNEDEVVEVIRQLATIDTIKGAMEFQGEDGECWKFVIKDGKAYECNGHIVYDECDERTEIN